MAWTLATWNVNSLRLRLPQVTAWWDQHRPDILLLQETKVDDALFPKDAFEARGLHLAFHGQKSYNGVAIVSRHPLRNVVWGFDGHVFEDQTRVIAADVMLPPAPVRAVSLYLPNGASVGSEKFDFKRRFVAAMQDWLAAEIARNPRIVVGGDYNISVDERDVDDPEKRGRECMFTPEERAWMQRFFELGMVDALRQTSNEAGIFSWWDYRMLSFQKNKGMRIDYNLAGPALKDVVGKTVHFRDMRKNEQPSDHIPVMTTFNE